MNIYSFALIVLLVGAVAVVPALRRVVLDVVVGAGAYVMLFFDWLFVDVFGIHMPAGWAHFRAATLVAYHRLTWAVMGFSMFNALIVLALIACLVFDSTRGVAICCGLLMAEMSIIFFPYNGLKMWLGLKPARSLALIIMILALIPVLNYNAPSLFGPVWGPITYGIVAVSFMIYVVYALTGKSTNVPHWIMTFVAIAVVAGSALMLMFPQEVRAMKALNAVKEKKLSLYSLEEEQQAFNTKGQVVRQAIVWQLTFDRDGNVTGKQPRKNGDQIVILAESTRFRTKESAPLSHQAQGTYIEILLPINSELDEYPLPNPDDRWFVDYEKVVLERRTTPPTTPTTSTAATPSVSVTINPVAPVAPSEVPVTTHAGEFVVDPTVGWQDTGVKVAPGTTFHVTSSGFVVWDESLPAVGPNGTFPASTVSRPSDFPAPAAGCGSLVMKIGDAIYAVGAEATITTPTGGSILLTVNDRQQSLSGNSGNFRSKIELN